MNRPPHRLLALLVAFAFFFVALPSADARSLAGSPHARTDWMSALVEWIASSFLDARGTVAAPAVHPPSSAVPIEAAATAGGGPVLYPNTGSCVDPNGRPAPCGPN